MVTAHSPWVRRGRAAAITSAALTLALALPAAGDPTAPAPSTAPAAPATPTTADPTDPAGPSSPTSSPGDSGDSGDSGDPADAFGYDGAAPEAGSDAPLGDADVDEQVAEARRLADGLVQDDKDIAAAVDELRRYSSQANTLLQRYATARDEFTAATKEADDAGRELDRLRGRLDEGRKDLRAWAFDTYTQGGGYSDTMTLVDSLGRDEHIGSTAGDLRYLTDNRIRTVDLVRDDTVTQADLTRTKEKAQKRASKAKREAAAAKKRVDRVITDRRSALADLRTEHASELRKAGPVVGALLGVARPDAQDAQQQLQDVLEESGQDVSEFEGAAPCSDNEGAYPNGQLPPGALCPLIGAPGESLRPRAAAAFNAMSKAYTRDTGQPICVTDSYRSYAEQVVVKSQRGGWAATPGKSNHGLGLALDLCGGINSFGHPAHLWMQQNAPLYGWYHPEWAGSGGSLPEPWHWEFGA